MSPKPLVGYTVRSLAASALPSMDERYSPASVEVAVSGFAESLAGSGVVPVSIPYAAEPQALLDHLDALILTGGQDVSKQFTMGERTRPFKQLNDSAEPSLDRDVYEWQLFELAMTRGVPVLGVCRGHQLINAGLGGTLISDLPPGPVDHLPWVQPMSDGQPDHQVTFTSGSLAEQLYGRSKVVNSWHHQAVAEPGRGMRISGVTTDGIVEATEHESAAILTVQWHPEWQESSDQAFAWLCARAGEYRERK